MPTDPSAPVGRGPAGRTTSAASVPGAAKSRADDTALNRDRWKAFSVCLVAAFMTLLDISIVNVALPSIRSGLDASQTQLQWIVSGYALAFGLFLVPAGRLGDVRGRRSVFVASLVVFTLASAAAGLAPGPTWLVAARLVQGIAGGVLNPQVIGFVQELFQGPERGRALGLQGSVIGISTAVGPLAGGALITAFGAAQGWRSVFFVNVPIGVVAVVLALRLLPKRSPQRRPESLDPVGVLLLGATTFLLLFPLVEMSGNAWKGSSLPGWLRWALFGVAALGAVVFVGWERRYRRRGSQPMVDLDLFGRLSYAFGVAIGLVYFAGFTSIFFVYALYLQTGLGYSALQSRALDHPVRGRSGDLVVRGRAGRRPLRAAPRGGRSGGRGPRPGRHGIRHRRP